MKRTIYPKDTQKTIHIEIVTKSGNISVEMKDTNGNVIFDEDNIAASSFDVSLVILR